MRNNPLPSTVQGSADGSFADAVSLFARLFPHRRLGGGALCVYLDGEPVVDVWTGYADRAGRTPWGADTGAMVFSATKGMAATVLHRLADRGLLDYQRPVADYWPEFGAAGKEHILVADLLRHRAGLSDIPKVSAEEIMDPVAMEHHVAAAPVGRHAERAAYHAITFGWLASGLARAITGLGMKELVRRELAQPLNTDGLHIGRPPRESATTAAEIIMPQTALPFRLPLTDKLIGQIAALPFAGMMGAGYYPGVLASMRGNAAVLDSEIPSLNGVPTARGLARLYAALANDGEVGGVRLLSKARVLSLAEGPRYQREHNIGVPMAFHLGYHSVPAPGVMNGFGHVGLGGTVGWADPGTGMAFALVHNRLVSPLMLTDHAAFVAVDALIRRGVRAARTNGYEPIPVMGSPYVCDHTADSGPQ